MIRSGGTARIWSRQRNDLTDGFRDIAAAAVSQLPDGVILDGELLVSTNGRLDFDGLQKRLVTTCPAKARQLIAAILASMSPSTSSGSPGSICALSAKPFAGPASSRSPPAG